MIPRERACLIILALLVGVGAILGIVANMLTGPAVATVVDYGDVIEVIAKVKREPLAVRHPFVLESPVPEPAGMTVRVLSPRGEVVVGAEVCVLGANEFFRGERTSGKGGVLVPYPLADRVLLTASFAGYAHHQRWLTAPYPEKLEVWLAPPATISGTVRLANGRPPSFPVRVFAWPSSLPPPPEAFGDRPSIPWTQTDAAGRFEVLGLDAGASYDLGAGTLGWTTGRIAEQVWCGENDADLTLWRFFSCLVQLRMEDGGLPPNSYYFARYRVSSSPVLSAEFIFPGSVDFALAGLGDLEVVRKPMDWRNRMLAYKVADPHIEFGPVDVLYDTPGFEETIASIPFFAVGDTIPARTVFLSRTAIGFGQIRIRLLSDAQIPSGLMIGGSPSATVWFTPLHDDAGEKALPVHYRDFGDVERNVEGIPFGEYRVDFVAADREYHDPALGEPLRKVSIGSTPTEITFDVRSLSTGVLLFPSVKRPISPSKLIIEAKRAKSVRSVTLAWGAPPYLFQGLLPGNYRLKFLQGSMPTGFKESFDIELHGSDLQRIAWPAIEGK